MARQSMTIDAVRLFFSLYATDIEIIETPESSATVLQAAAAHAVLPAQIAKTICIRVNGTTMLVVMSGILRLDNRKCRETFGGKPRMVDANEVAVLTGHPVGGVCPFGLATPLPVYCDKSLRNFEVVLPAAGSVNSAVRIDPERMAALVDARWVDISQDAAS